MTTSSATVSRRGTASRFAACAAAWCGVHCALTPLLIVAMPTLALSEGIERGMLAGTVVLGSLLLAFGPAREDRVVLATFAAGAALWFSSLAGWLLPIPEPVTSAPGSLLVAWALWQGSRRCHDGECAICDPETSSTDARA